jgi:dihydrofolate reductase
MRGDMSWAHKGKDDKEWNEFVEGNANSEGTLLFGRITYDLMAGFWPTPAAMEMDQVVAERMNGLQKIVFSRTLSDASWKNTRLIKEDLFAAVKKLKQEPASDIVILGSGTLVSQLAGKGLIDEYSIIINPIVIGEGRTLFENIDHRINLKLIRTRAFSNGNVLLAYQEA